MLAKLATPCLIKAVHGVTIGQTRSDLTLYCAEHGQEV
jgi:hypothetical protein